MEKLCAFFSHPERAFPTIHVAGTNGKGSVCTKMAAALQCQGYRTGLYTSPHISSFCERIRIDGVPISETEICRLYQQIREMGAVFFEIATLLAFLYFREQKVDIAVIETGIGGAYDATNVISPLVSVITSIGYDHQEILGQSLQEICRAKAGILKPNTPVVLGKTVPAAWVIPLAEKKGCPLLQTTTAYANYDEENREVARLALEAISDRFPIQPAALKKGLQAKPPCRFERREVRGKELILDVAHNLQGFERLLDQLRYSYPHSSFRFVCGFSRGKEIGACAKLIENAASAVHLVSKNHPRLASVEELAPYFNSPALEASIDQGIRNACLVSSGSEVIVITGSFFIMDEALLSIN